MGGVAAACPSLIWIGAGLFAAGTAGISAWGLQLPFLTALAFDFYLPLLGPVHLSSVLLFDLGVFMLVFERP